MSGEFTVLGIIFMCLAWVSVIGLTVFSLGKAMMKNELSKDE
jgi:hypothetical protein